MARAFQNISRHFHLQFRPKGIPSNDVAPQVCSKLLLSSSESHQIPSRCLSILSPLTTHVPSDGTLPYKNTIHTSAFTNRSNRSSYGLKTKDRDLAKIQDPETQDAKDVAEQISNVAQDEHTLGRLFAVVQVFGKQRKVTPEDIIVVDNMMEADIGDKIRLEKVLLVGSQDFTLIGRPLLSRNMVNVEATVVEKTLEYVKIFFTYKKRKDVRKMRLTRQGQTFLRINSIEVNLETLPDMIGKQK
ncbi:unnamed protein product [Owenia fusiformis]|uniref:Large ribosomal subunit protein bL21m n=1 Tax=Owenia fusiformis TaxID=6347 RepID=A0A8J1TE35_OWEFU|nr:unnamed protein product [Owenia fusiformis]